MIWLFQLAFWLYCKVAHKPRKPTLLCMQDLRAPAMRVYWWGEEEIKKMCPEATREIGHFDFIYERANPKTGRMEGVPWECGFLTQRQHGPWGAWMPVEPPS